MKYTKSIRKGRTLHGKQLCKIDTRLELLQYVTHDMKAPLHSILGFTENIKRKMAICVNGCCGSKDDLLKSVMRDLDIVTKESESLAYMISNILDYSGFQNNDIMLEKSHFTVEGLMKDISEFIEPIIKGYTLEYALELQDYMPPLFADRSRLLQVLKNLVTNAVKFTSSGKIACQVEFEEEVFRFSVADTGCGIPEEKREQIFSKFYRVENRNGRYIAGSGLGLAICKSIVELHDGKIWIESAVPQGTIFHFTIPM